MPMLSVWPILSKDRAFDCSSYLQLGAGVDRYQSAGQHADLSDSVKGGHPDSGQRHHLIDDEEGEPRHQTQAEEIE